MNRTGKVVAASLVALCLYLTAEAFLPPSSQPTAKLSLALIHGYQATGSKAMESGGIQCRYRPTCSHYAEDAITYYGTLDGGLRTAGRLWRCSPWGGSGYDPAVEPHSAAYFAPQETPEEKKQREEMEKKAAEDIKKATKELREAFGDSGKEAGKAAAACGVGCVVMAITGLGYLAVKIFCMVWAFKDAKSRGDQNAILWPILIFFLTPVIGLVIYIVTRPKGDLSPCGSCHQQRLSTLTKCPHCGVDSAAPPPAAAPPAKA